MKQWQNLTDMLTNQDVFDEMSKKYKNTILGIKTNVKSIYATFIGNDDMFVFRDEHGQQLKIADNTDMEIFIPNPEKGLYNTPYGAMMYQRNPKRQWKRGLNAENVQVFSINLSVTHRGRPQANTNKFDIAWSHILPEETNQPITMAEALERAKERGSAAINRTYGVVLHPKEPDGFVLLHHRYQIGTVRDGVIKVLNNIFRQEVLDTCNQWCPTYEVR